MPGNRSAEECANLRSLLRRLLQQQVSTKEILLQLTDQNASNSLIANWQTTLTELEREIEFVGEEIREGCPVFPPPQPPWVTLDGIEVTQSVQDMSQSVPLVAGKTTVVRVYLSPQPNTSPTVTGTLSAVAAPGQPPVFIQPLNPVSLSSAMIGQLTQKREDVSLSLNFLIPATLTAAGSLTLQLTKVVDSAGQSFRLEGVASSIQVQFTKVAAMRVKIIGLRYSTGMPPVSFAPAAIDYTLIRSWLQRAYPINDLIMTTTVVDSINVWPFDCNAANTQITAIRNLDIDGGADHRTHYFGLVADGGGANFMRGCAAGIPITTPDPSTVASGPTGKPSGNFSWDTDGSYGDWYTGHELGHTYGRQHPGFCNQTFDDHNYPFANGQLSNSDDKFIGFDVGDSANGLPMKALPGSAWYDVMTYCVNEWLSSYTYMAIMNRLNAENPLIIHFPPVRFPFHLSGAPNPLSHEQVQEPEDRPQFINVVASVNLSQASGRIEHVLPLERAVEPPAVGQSRVKVRLTSTSGQVLATVRVELKMASCNESVVNQMGVISAMLPWSPDAKTVELLLDNRVIGAFTSGDTAPEIRNLRHTFSKQQRLLSLTWEGQVPAAGKYEYIVQTSEDGGYNWRTVSLGKTEPSHEIDLSAYKSIPNLFVRIIATNGFTRKIVSSGPIQSAQ